MKVTGKNSMTEFAAPTEGQKETIKKGAQTLQMMNTNADVHYHKATSKGLACALYT